MKQLTVVLERANGELFARAEVPNYKIYTAGATIVDVEKGVRELLTDYLENEGLEVDEWKNAKADEVQLEYVYDVAAFFATFDAVKINSIAKLAGLNQALVRHYASGAKFPSAKQLKKIEDAVHELGRQLLEISLVPAA